MYRRLFCVTTASSGAMIAMKSLHQNSVLAQVLAGRNLTKSDIPTPALLVDLDAFEANVQKMAGHCRATNLGTRPHAKTHKCPEIAKRQIAAGAVGICVATVPEAEALAAAGIDNILLTSPIVDVGKMTRIVDLASKRQRKIMLSVGHKRQVDLLTQVAAQANVQLDVLIDLDVGDRRTGILPGAPAVELAQHVSRSKQLTVRGVQAYAGFASHVAGFEKRSQTSREALALAVQTKQMLLQAGFDAQILSGGSTGTYNIDSQISGMTELQVGSYIFMDVSYRAIGGQDGGAIYTDFQPSLTVLATVVSNTHAGRVSIDAGTKGLDTTTTSVPEVKNAPHLVYAKAGDEFGALTSDSSARLPEIGDRLELIVPHCDPSINLYDRLYACRGEIIEAIWPITARRETATQS